MVSSHNRAETDAPQWICSPACTELEQVVLDWCAKLFGLSEDFYISSKKGGGVIIVGLNHQALQLR